MLSKIKLSLCNINYRLFFALLATGFAPTCYNTVRVFFLGQLPNEWAYSIAGQLSWVNLLYEIANEALILPLFYFIGTVREDRHEFANRIRTGLLITLGVYIPLSAAVLIFAEPMLSLMAADASILSPSASYIRIESVANVFAVLAQFTLIALTTVGKSKYLYAISFARLILCLVSDTFLVSTLPCSANLGVNGIGYSNIIVNALLLAISLFLLAKKEGVSLFTRFPCRFAWAKALLTISGISGAESLVRNLAYMIMIVRMVNTVHEQGTYWVANNFIWGWLLLPILQLGELIKQEIATDQRTLRRNSLGYFFITGVISCLWFISIPFWKPFITNVLDFTDADKLFDLTLLLIGFYVPFAFQNICDATFYGLGKTNYMLAESIITNTIYYGTAFLLYRRGLWVPSLTGIALLFGIGNLFDSLISFGAYAFLLQKQNIRLLKP
ncbi:MAG: multidrug transporter [Clostridia bacterium]|nr:multidrug transporter [Clostridia bacterium]